MRFGVVGIQVRQTHIRYLAPLACAGLNIAVMFTVKGVLLYTVVQVQRIVQRLSVARRTGIFRQSVNHKADGIKLLLGVQRVSLAVHTPVHATILLIDKMLYDIVLGARGSLQVLRVFQHTESSREGPQDTSIQDSAFLRLWVQLALTIHPAVKATMLIVHHLIQPETQDIMLQHILHLLLHHIYLPYHFLIG